MEQLPIMCYEKRWPQILIQTDNVRNLHQNSVLIYIDSYQLKNTESTFV